MQFRRAIVGQMDIDGRGSAIVEAKEKKTGKLIGRQVFYLSDVHRRATLNISFNANDFPNVKTGGDVDIVVMHFKVGMLETFRGDIFGIVDAYS